MIDMMDFKRLNSLVDRLTEYLGVEKIPFEFSNEINDDSRLLLKPSITILVSNKFIDNYYESAKALVHEYRHWFQLNWVSYIDDNLSKLWGKAFKNAIFL